MFKTIEQAGAVTFRIDAGGPEFLLVRAKKDPQHWIFPKGHIEPGEDSADTALRELREEAGAIANVVEFLGVTEYQSGTDTVRVQYYLCRFDKQIDEGEGRERAWCGVERADDLLSFENLRGLTHTAVAIVQEQSHGHS
jgi:8-oxo-dGTP pyrophosphatase MutT (NUDIX family)